MAQGVALGPRRAVHLSAYDSLEHDGVPRYALELVGEFCVPRRERHNQGSALDSCAAIPNAFRVLDRALPGVVSRSAAGRRDERWRLAGSLGLAAFVHAAAVVAIRAFAAGAVASRLALPIEIEAPNLEWQAGELAPPKLAADRRFVAAAPAAAMAGGREPELHPGARVASRERRSNGAQQPALGTDAEVTQESKSGFAQPASEHSVRPKTVVLALEQLGFGFSNPFLEPSRAPGPRVEPRRRSKAEAAQARLEASLRGSIVAADSRAGIGHSGPLAASLRSAFTESSLLRDTVDLVAEIDQDGRLVSLTGTGSNAREIAWAIERARGSLKGNKFNIPKGAAGLRVRLRVTVGMKLPSGHDLKPAVKVFGIPVTKGAGERSSSVEFFPKPVGAEPSDVPDRSSPLPPVSTVPVFGLQGDPSDFGAAGRRFVQALVLSEETL